MIKKGRVVLTNSQIQGLCGKRVGGSISGVDSEREDVGNGGIRNQLVGTDGKGHSLGCCAAVELFGGRFRCSVTEEDEGGEKEELLTIMGVMDALMGTTVTPTSFTQATFWMGLKQVHW